MTLFSKMATTSVAASVPAACLLLPDDSTALKLRMIFRCGSVESIFGSCGDVRSEGSGTPADKEETVGKTREETNTGGKNASVWSNAERSAAGSPCPRQLFLNYYEEAFSTCVEQEQIGGESLKLFWEPLECKDRDFYRSNKYSGIELDERGDVPDPKNETAYGHFLEQVSILHGFSCAVIEHKGVRVPIFHDDDDETGTEKLCIEVGKALSQHDSYSQFSKKRTGHTGGDWHSDAHGTHEALTELWKTYPRLMRRASAFQPNRFDQEDALPDVAFVVWKDTSSFGDDATEGGDNGCCADSTLVIEREDEQGTSLVAWKWDEVARREPRMALAFDAVSVMHAGAQLSSPTQRRSWERRFVFVEPAGGALSFERDALISFWRPYVQQASGLQGED